MTRIPSAPALWALFLALATGLSGMPAASGLQQDPLASALTPKTEQAADSPAVANWRTLTRRTRVLQEEVGTMLSGISLTDVDAQNAQLARIEKINAQLTELKMETFAAAAVAFGENPKATSNLLLARDALSWLRVLMGEDPEIPMFNPAEASALTSRFIAGGCNDPKFTRMALRALVGCQAFEQIPELSARLKELETPIDQPTTDLLAKMAAKWQRELEFRKRDETAELPLVRIETDSGFMVAELFEDDAPNTVNNFVSLVKKGFYTDQIFFGVQPGFIVATGCPDGTGSGGPGYTIPPELGLPTARDHFAGCLSVFHMSGEEPGSRFGIVYQPVPDRDGQFTVFGRIIEGAEVLNAMPTYAPVDQLAGKKPSRLVSMTMIRERNHEYAPQQTTPSAGSTPADPGMKAVPPATDPAGADKSGNTPPGAGSGGTGTVPAPNPAFPPAEPPPGATPPASGGGGLSGSGNRGDKGIPSR